MPNHRFWFYLIAFNVFWFLCVRYGNVAAWCAFPFCLFLFRHQLAAFTRNWRGLALAGFCIALDVALHLFGWVRFTFTPFWLLPLWLIFLLSYSTLYAMLLTKPWWLSLVFGAIFGPLSYWGGIQLGALSVSALWVFVVWSVSWAITFVGLRYCHRLH